jgi:type IV secretory pathway VirD2 relaxase
LFYDATDDDMKGRALAADWGESDRRHFRIILSPENGSRLGDLKSYTREVMARAEAALGTKLEWVAVDHHDTDNPHTHIILRGRRDDGRDLVIPRDYVSHGFRSAAQDVATERLGPRGRDDARLALVRETRAHRLTRLDRMIDGQLDEQGRIRVAQLRSPNRSPDLTDALKARAQELKRLGLAREVSRNVFQFEPGWQDALKAMELHLDIRKALMRSRAQEQRRAPDDPARMSKTLRTPPRLDR